MPNEINLVLGLICHHGNWDNFIRDARVIQKVSFEKGVPITYFFSGVELDAIANHREYISTELWFDIVGAIQGNHFINPRMGFYDANKPELAVAPYNHIPLVQPWDTNNWYEYFEGLLKPQMLWSKSVAEQKFHKTPVTAHPPDGVYAPAAADVLKKCGFDVVVVSGECLADAHAKGIMYWASGLRHLMRTPDIQPQFDEYINARHFVDAVEAYGHQNDIPFVTAICDMDELNGMNGMSLAEGVARLCCIGDEVYYRKNVNMINANAAAHYNLHQTPIEKFWNWNDVHSMINAAGNLDFMDNGKNNEISHVIWLIGERYRQGWNGDVIQQAKKYLWCAADIACRYKNNDYGLHCHYQYNIDSARYLLQG